MSTRTVIAAIVAAWLGGAAPVVAEPPARPGLRAAFALKLIEASKAAKPYTDPRLAGMKPHLRPFEGKYNRFVLKLDRILRLAVNQRGAVKLPAGEFAITFLGFGTGKVRRVRYRVELPRQRTRMTRKVAPGGQTLDVIGHGAKLTIVSTTVQR